jgi:hypothetical protein
MPMISLITWHPFLAGPCGVPRDKGALRAGSRPAADRAGGALPPLPGLRSAGGARARLVPEPRRHRFATALGRSWERAGLPLGRAPRSPPPGLGPRRGALRQLAPGARRHCPAPLPALRLDGVDRPAPDLARSSRAHSGRGESPDTSPGSSPTMAGPRSAGMGGVGSVLLGQEDAGRGAVGLRNHPVEALVRCYEPYPASLDSTVGDY